jgi:hypothetical protein
VRVTADDGALDLLPAETGFAQPGVYAANLLISAARAATLKLANQRDAAVPEAPVLIHGADPFTQLSARELADPSLDLDRRCADRSAPCRSRRTSRRHRDGTGAAGRHPARLPGGDGGGAGGRGLRRRSRGVQGPAQPDHPGARAPAGSRLRTRRDRGVPRATTCANTSR